MDHRPAEPARLARGVLLLAATGLAYAMCILVLAAGGDVPGDLPPWLNIPRADYFWWEALFIAPVIVASGLLASASIYLLAKWAGGTGSFDDTVALVGPAVAGCTLFTLIPDLLIGVLLNTGALSSEVWMREVTRPSLTLGLVWTYMVLYLAAFLVSLPAVVAAAHGLRRLSAVAIGWAGFAIYQGVLLIFVR
jgi:hypothetical protein